MAAERFYLPFRPTFDMNGVALPNAKLFFYYAGGTTPAPAYSDAGLTIPVSHPVVADAAGRWPVIYLNDAITYRVVVKDKTGTTIPGHDDDPYYPVDFELVQLADASADAAAASAAAAAVSAVAADNSADAAAASEAAIIAAMLTGSAFTNTTVAAAVTAGLAATADGGFFVATGDDINEVRQYKDVAGVASLIYSVPKASALPDLTDTAASQGYLPSTLNFTGGACYSTQRLILDYEGNCLRLLRVSDGAERDFGFDENNRLDEAAVLAWLGAKPIGYPSGSINNRILKWYDQSGKGNHADNAGVAAADRAPLIVSSKDGRYVPLIGSEGNGTGGVGFYIDLPAAIAKSPRSCGVFMTYHRMQRATWGWSSLGMPRISTGDDRTGAGAAGGCILVLSDYLTGEISIAGHQTSATPKALGIRAAGEEVETLGLVMSTTGVHVLAGTRVDKFVATAVPMFDNAQIPTGGKIGSIGVGADGFGEVRTVLFTVEPTVPLARQACRALNRAHNAPVNQASYLWVIGDSITAMFGVDVGASIASDLGPGGYAGQHRSDIWYNVWAKSGATLNDMNTSITEAGGPSGWIAAMGGTHRAVIWGGTNDETAGDNLATLQADLATLAATLRTAGVSKVYAGTLFPISSFDNTLRTNFNNWLKTTAISGGTIDGVVDYDGEGTFTTIDGVHLTLAGGVEAGRVLGEAVNRLF